MSRDYVVAASLYLIPSLINQHFPPPPTPKSGNHQINLCPMSPFVLCIYFGFWIPRTSETTRNLPLSDLLPLREVLPGSTHPVANEAIAQGAAHAERGMTAHPVLAPRGALRGTRRPGTSGSRHPPYRRPRPRPCCWPPGGRRAGCRSAARWGSPAPSAAAPTAAPPSSGWCCSGTSKSSPS